MIDSDDDIYIYLCKEQKKMYLVNGWASVYLNSIYRCGCFCVYMSYYVTVAIQMFLFRLTRRERRVCERSTGCFDVEGDHSQMLFDLNPFRRSLRFRLVPDRFQ